MWDGTCSCWKCEFDYWNIDSTKSNGKGFGWNCLLKFKKLGTSSLPFSGSGVDVVKYLVCPLYNQRGLKALPWLKIAILLPAGLPSTVLL
jgi:hypothetical protein